MLRALLSKQYAQEEREAAKALARAAKTTVSSYLRQLLQREYQRKVENFNPELFRPFEIGGDYSTGNPKFIEGMKRRKFHPMKARTSERKKDDKL